jgi:hypothetical protein
MRSEGWRILKGQRTQKPKKLQIAKNKPQRDPRPPADRRQASPPLALLDLDFDLSLIFGFFDLWSFAYPRPTSFASDTGAP